MKNYAVLVAPNFRLQALLRHSPDLAGKPVALWEKKGRKPKIVELNARAQSASVEVGMTPTQAMARCPSLQSLPANPRQEQTVQDILVQIAENLSPFFETTGPGIITVELPPKRITEAEFMEKWVGPLLDLHLSVQVGVAPTPGLALLGAHFANPILIVDNPSAFLAPLPVESLEVSVEFLLVLRSWGISRIGQLVALPRHEVCLRLGGEAVAVWERACGGRSRPLKLVKPREFYVEQSDLEHPIEMLEPLLFLLRRFLEQITTRLSKAYRVAGQLKLVLQFESTVPYQRVFTIPQPTGNVDLLFRMLHTHLQEFKAKSPIVAVELAVTPGLPSVEQFNLLEQGVHNPQQLAETLGRLQALLGAERVGTPELEPWAHPDCVHLRPYDANAPFCPSEDPVIGMPLMRFRPPTPARIRLEKMDPAFLYSTHFTGPIKEAQGPWRCQGNWWDEKQWNREEWDAVTDQGVYRLVRDNEDWFVDGIYG